MERITPDISAEIREQLKQLAEAQDRPEADLARELLRRGLAKEQETAFYEAVQRSMNPAAARRMTELAEALEAVVGHPG